MAARTNSHQPVRCAIYTRQSVVRGGGDPALASCVLQREKCLDFVRAHERHGWRALDERFHDEGYSGATVERPGLERLVELVAQPGVDRLVVYRLDRLTRSLGDWVRISAMLQRQNVKLSIVAGALDADSGALARMQLNTLAVFAELEREMIGEPLANARALRRANGHRTSGRVPLGYASDPRTRQLVIVEAEANVVRWFFAEAASGATTVELVTRANDLGFAMKSGKRGAWTGREVLRLLRNPTYAGRLSDGAPAVHTPIVAPEQFNRVQEIISGRQTRPTTARGPIDENVDPFILRGLLACSTTMTLSHRRQLHLPIHEARRHTSLTVIRSVGGWAGESDGRAGEEADGGDVEARQGGVGRDAGRRGPQDGAQVRESREVAVRVGGAEDVAYPA